MSAEEAKPVDVPAAAPATEPAAVAPVAVPEPAAAPEEAAAPAVEAPKTEEPESAATTATPAAATTEAAKEEEPTKEAKPVEPKESGHLHYNAPSNFLKEYLPLPPKKVFFWLDEDPVDPAKLKAYLAKGKEAASSTAAWASQTGKGLLFFNKHGEDKAAPSGALNLAEAEDIKEAGPNEFAFKLHGHRHKFVAESPADRDSWLGSIKKIAEDAKAKKDELVNSEGYKAAIAKLKPAPVAAAAVATPKAADETPKKSTDKKVDDDTPVDSDAKKTTKSRSRSRDAFAGLFKTKKDEKPAEAKAEDAVAPTETAAVAAPADPAASEPVAAPVATDAAAPTEEKKVEPETPKETKKDRRQSRFETFLTSVASGKKPKKEAAAEPAEAKAEEATPAEAAVAADPVAAAAPTEEAAKVEEPIKESETTPTKERKPSLLTGLKGFAQKVRSPSTEQAPAAEASKTPVEKAEAALEGTDAPAATAESAAPAVDDAAVTNGEPSKSEKRRSSFFNFAAVKKAIDTEINKMTSPPAAAGTAAAGDAAKSGEAAAAKPADEAAAVEAPKKSVEEKTDAPTPAKESPITQLGRRFSKVIRGDKAKKDTKVPAVSDELKKEEPVKAAEAAEASVPKVDAPAAKVEELAAPATIGDVVPEAVSVGAPSASKPVSAAA